MNVIYIIIILIILIITCILFLKTDCGFLFNILFRRNTYVSNSIIANYWKQLTKIMYNYSTIIEPGTNSIPNKINDIYEYFINNSDRMNIRNIAEIGFNAGHSCVCMLVLFPNSKITIFDIDKHKYTQKCFNLLDNAFPNRLRLIKGDSTKTIPMYDNKNIHDLVHIDGGHFNDIPLKDLYNSYNYLLSNKGYIIFDDTYYKNSVLLNIILSNCDNIFNMFIAEHKNTMNVVKVCNGSTISYVNK